MRAKFVNEAIKHLKPRSEEELESYYEDLDSDEKLLVGFKNNNEDLVIQALTDIPAFTKIGKLFLNNKKISITIDTCVDIKNNKINPNGKNEEIQFLHFLDNHNIKYKIIQKRGPGGGWPFIEYTGKAKDIIRLLLEPFDSGLDGYDKIEELEMYLFGEE